MKKIHTRHLLFICLASLLFQISSISALGQQQQNTTQPEQQEQDDDILRISTDLVQTNVSVFDKKGRFVEGLKKEDFELKVDDKPVDVGFFERITAGTAREEIQIAAARGEAGAKKAATETTEAKPVDRGRVIIFFVDDIHIAPDNLKRAKDTIVRFIDREMGQNDLVAITSASGQIGFLQQYTDNKDVLKKAVARLTYKPFGTRDWEPPNMTEGQAVLIERENRPVIAYFIKLTTQMMGVTPGQAEAIVRRRARVLLNQAAILSKAMFSSLQTLARRSAAMPGRKLIFFISDGFAIDTRNSDTLERMRSIIDASLRSGVVIYSVDARGLVTDMMDATVDPPPPEVAAAMRGTGEDVLNALAADTGGRFIHNTNDFGPDLTRAVKETSNYYLLAWRPNEEAGGGKKFRRVQVRIKNRPELSVKVQRGYFQTPAEAKQKENTNAKATAPSADPLRKAITGLVPKRELPTRLALSYMDTPSAGWTLVASMKVDSRALKFEQQGDHVAAVVEIAGTIYDAQGKALDNFRQRLNVNGSASDAGVKAPDIIYNHSATLKPGLYQVRVAALDKGSGQTGSAAEWVEIPDLSKQGLSMSSLIVGERKPSALEAKTTDVPVEGVAVSVDHRFEHSSNLRFLVYIYNAARGSAAAPVQPDVALQVQIFRDGQPVLTLPPRQLSTESQDLTHLAYAAEIPLQELKPGQYVLQVTAIDRLAKTTAAQKVRFEVK
jgi:VWFA-related protein